MIELVAENRYGAGQASVIAQWCLRNNARPTEVTREALEALAADKLHGDEWCAVVEDLYSFPVLYDGDQYQFVFDVDASCWLATLPEDRRV